MVKYGLLSRIMPKLNLTEVINDDDVKQILNPYEYEYRCAACDNFFDPVHGYSEYAIQKCPFEGKVTWYTDWRKIGCKCFMD